MTIAAAGIDRASARAMAARSSDTGDAKPSSRTRSAHVPALPCYRYPEVRAVSIQESPFTAVMQNR